MSVSFSIQGCNIAEANLDPSGVGATNSHGIPKLLITLNFLYRAHPNLGSWIDYRELRARISAFEKGYIADSLSTDLNLRLEPGKEIPNQLVYLEFPIDYHRLTIIERLRKGGDVRLKFDLKLSVDELVLIGFPDKRGWALKNRHLAYNTLQITVPRSVWVEHVLRCSGFGATHIIELPTIPIESCAGMQEAFEALKQAQKLETEGYYQEAVAKCRHALEPFLELVDKVDDQGETKKVPKLKASWQTRLSQRTYEWLDSSLAAIKSPTNQAAHLSSTKFDQMEAQMLLMIVTALVAYAVKMRPDPA